MSLSTINPQRQGTPVPNGEDADLYRLQDLEHDAYKTSQRNADVARRKYFSSDTFEPGGRNYQPSGTINESNFLEERLQSAREVKHWIEE